MLRALRRIPSHNSLLVIICCLFSTGVSHGVSAQNMSFSSEGTSSDFDSLRDDFTSKNRPKLNSSLYRNKVRDSVGQRLGQYCGKYNDRLNQTTQYRSRYGETSNRIKQFRSVDQVGKYRNKYTADERYRKYKQVTNTADKAKSLTDQLLSGKLKLDSNTVFNSKIMQKYTDSLRKVMPTPPTNPFEEVSKDQLIDEVNKQFRSSADSLRDSTKLIGDAKKKKEWIDLNYARIKDTDGSDLKPMATAIVQKAVLKRIDSLRVADLKAARTKMEEKERNARERVTTFREKENFWRKSYLEGILSIANGSGAFQFSPAWAYHITQTWSIGGGPNLSVNRRSTDFKVDVGARILTKYEMFHRSTYLQAEDWINPAAVGLENIKFTQQNFLAGGGYVFPILSPLTINIAAMYKIYSTGTTSHDGPNWIFRIGISTNKKKLK